MTTSQTPLPIVSLTRLRLARVTALPGFAWHAAASVRQLRQAPGYLAGAALPDGWRCFWTMTLWQSEAQMLAYMTSGAHRRVMSKLAPWCDEASVARIHGLTALPDWNTAYDLMLAHGRPSPLTQPGPNHASMAIPRPKRIRGAPLPPPAR